MIGAYAPVLEILNDLEIKYFGVRLPYCPEKMHAFREEKQKVKFPPEPMPEYFFALSQRCGIGAFYINIEGKYIELSSTNYMSFYGPSVFSHTSNKHSNLLYTKCSQLYEAAMQESDPELLLQKLGIFFWVNCQAKLWSKGEPAIGEMIIRAVLASKGLKFSGWKLGIIPWVEVFKYIDGNEFGKNFKNLLQ